MLLLHDIELTKLVNSTFSLDDHVTIARQFTQIPTELPSNNTFDFDANMLSFFIDYLVPEYLAGNTLSHRSDLDVKYEYRLGELAKQQYKPISNQSIKLDAKSYPITTNDTKIIVRYNKPNTEKMLQFTSKISTNINYGNLNVTVSYPPEDILNTLVITEYTQSSTVGTTDNQQIFTEFKTQFSIGSVSIHYELPEPLSTKIIKTKPIIPEHQLENTDYFEFNVSEIENILTTVSLFGDITHDY